MDFISTPTQQKIPRNAAMNDLQIEICDGEISSLLQKGAVSPSDGAGFISGFFVVPKSSGGWRPIINLKGLNQFIPHQHFKMEGVNTVRHTVRLGDWLAKIDLKDAYLTVALDPEQRHLFQFRWRGKFFKFISMPFGLGPAPGVFTKLLKPIASFLRQRGLRLVVYLDDILVVSHSKESAQEAVKQVTALFISLGFVIHEEKSVMVPTQSLEYIGLVIDTAALTFSLPPKKVDKLLRMCTLAYTSNSPSLKDLASLLGVLNWAVHSVNYAPAHYRNLQAFYAKRSKAVKGDLLTQFPLP